MNRKSTSRNHNKRRERKRYYDAATDHYVLSDAELANLRIGRDANALVGAANAARVHKLAAAGRSARDIMLITGLSRPTVYRALRRALGVQDHDALTWPKPRDPLLE